MTRQYACVQCCQPIPEGHWGCPLCGGMGAEVLEPEPFQPPPAPTTSRAVTVTPVNRSQPEPGITRDQYTAICRHFSAQGEVNRARRMRRLTAATGRDIGDYWDLTEAEADRLLKEWAHGIRR